MECRNNKLVNIKLSEADMNEISTRNYWIKRKKKRRKPYVTQTDGIKTSEESMSISVLGNLFIPVDKLINFQIINNSNISRYSVVKSIIPPKDVYNDTI